MAAPSRLAQASVLEFSLELTDARQRFLGFFRLGQELEFSMFDPWLPLAPVAELEELVELQPIVLYLVVSLVQLAGEVVFLGRITYLHPQSPNPPLVTPLVELMGAIAPDVIGSLVPQLLAEPMILTPTATEPQQLPLLLPKSPK